MKIYKEVPNDSNVLVSSIMKAIEKIRLHGDLLNNTLNYFPVKDPDPDPDQKTFKIQCGPLNCDNEKVLYFLKCKVCGEGP